METIEHLITAFDEKYISEQELREGEAMAETSLRLVNGYISYLDKSKREAK